MGTSNFSGVFKRDAVAQITERGDIRLRRFQSVWVSARIPSMLGGRNSQSRPIRAKLIRLGRSAG